MSRVAQRASEVPAVGEWERVQSVGGEPPSGEVVVLFISNFSLRGNFEVMNVKILIICKEQELSEYL